MLTWGRSRLPFAAAVWKPAERAQASRQYVLSPGVLSRNPRPADFCYGCESVVVHPPESGGPDLID